MKTNIVKRVLIALLTTRIVRLVLYALVLFTFLSLSASAQPLKVCVIQDKSTSGISYGTPNMKYIQLLPILGAVDKRAGEMAYGLIQGESNKPLFRYYAPELPPKPVLDIEGLDPKGKRKALHVHKIKLASWFKKRSERSEYLEIKRHSFQLESKEDMELEFFASSSDIFGALHRCLLYLGEITPELSSNPAKYVVFISDNEHSGSSEPPVKKLPADVKLIIVNGRRWPGSLKHLSFTAFEGIDSAFRFVLSDSKNEEVKK